MNPTTNFEDLKIDSQPQANGVLPHVNGWSISSNGPIIAEQPNHTKRKLRVVCAGAAIEGLDTFKVYYSTA
jgi:hypothetical protein